MNERTPRDADIIPFPDKIKEINELSDSDVIRHFLGELRHPGVQPHLAEYIVDVTTARPRDNDSMSEDRLVWRERLNDICSGKNDEHPDNIFKATLGKESLDIDEVTILIEDALRATVSRANELVAERKALRRLLDLREAAVVRGLYDEDIESWKKVITRLVV